MIARFLFRNPRILMLCVVVIITSGTTSLFVLPRLEDPVLGQRVGLISTVIPGADAERVESLVTIPLESELHGIAEIKQVRSNSLPGISNIVVELDDEVVNVEPVWTLIRDRISNARDQLPDNSMTPSLSVIPLKAFAAIISLRSATESPNISVVRRHALQLQAELNAVPGTERTDIFGDPGEEYVVEITPPVLASLGLSTGAIAQQISGQRTDRPAGVLQYERIGLGVSITDGNLPVDQLADAQIRFGPQGQSVRLAEIATIRKQLVSPESDLAIAAGHRAIVLGVLVDNDQRVDKWTDRMRQVLSEFEDSHAGETIAEVVFLQRHHVDQRMSQLLYNLTLGTIAVTVVVLLLMGWRSMLVVAAALPLSALMVLSAMRVLGIPIHQMSVTGLIIALGLLIDNAIVMVEEIRSRILAGTRGLDAITGSVQQLAMPLLGSTLTTALAFLPIATLPGPPGEFVGTIAVSVILAIASSLLLAMTVIPALISLLHLDTTQHGLFSYGLSSDRIRRRFESSLRFVLRHPWVGIVCSSLLPAAGFWFSQELHEQFFPPADRRQIQIELELAASTGIDATRQTVDQVEQIVGGNLNVERQHWFIGRSAPTFFYNVVPRRRGTPFYAQALIDLADGADARAAVQQLQTKLDDLFPQSRAIVRQLEQGPPFDAPVELRIRGPELSTLQDLGRQLRLILSQTPNVIHTRSDLEETVPRISLEMNQPLIQHSGLDQDQIAAQLYTSLHGAPAGSIESGDEELPIRVKVAISGDHQFDRLFALPLQSTLPSRPDPSQLAAGRPGNPRRRSSLPSTTLASLSRPVLAADVGAIVRIDGYRTNEVKAFIKAGVLPSTVLASFKQRLQQSGFTLPSGYKLQFGGETEQRSQAVERLIANAVTLFTVMLLILVASFGSFRCAMVIAAVGGLSAGLGPLSLWIFGYPFGFMAIVGTMGLVGVAINDSIVVLAAIRSNELAREGDPDQMRAVVIGCTRHIIATTLTTIVGFLPLIIAGGGFWPPLAIAIAGGVGGATFLALYFVPSAYVLLIRPRRTAQVNP